MFYSILKYRTRTAINRETKGRQPLLMSARIFRSKSVSWWKLIPPIKTHMCAQTEVIKMIDKKVKEIKLGVPAHLI